VGWDLDGRVGSVIIDGRERVGLAWVRDRARKRLVFHALPVQISTEASGAQPPGPDEFEVDEAAFKPVFSTAWARRRRGRGVMEAD
jgi:hypothetical protein